MSIRWIERGGGARSAKPTPRRAVGAALVVALAGCAASALDSLPSGTVLEVYTDRNTLWEGECLNVWACALPPEGLLPQRGSRVSITGSGWGAQGATFDGTSACSEPVALTARGRGPFGSLTAFSGAARATAVAVTVLPRPATVEVDVDPPTWSGEATAATVTVTVRGTDGQPLPGAYVTLGSDPSIWSLSGAGGTTGDRGELAFQVTVEEDTQFTASVFGPCGEGRELDEDGACLDGGEADAAECAVLTREVRVVEQVDDDTDDTEGGAG